MWLVLVIISLTILYLLLKKHYRYWKNLGIPGPTPSLFVGNIGKSFTGKLGLGEIINQLYKEYEGYPFVGIYRGMAPCLLVRDIDFIKKVTSSDFKYFQDNDINIRKDIDPIFGRHPFVLKGEEWKISRARIAPCFTSMKMKMMHHLIVEVSNRMVNYVESKKESTNSTGLEARELCTLFTLDNVAVCAFGLEGYCFKDPKCEFREIAHKFVSPDTWLGLKFMLSGLLPKKFNFFNLRFVSQEVEDRLTNMVEANMKYRKDNNIDRNDFFQTICQLFEKDDPKEAVFNLVANAASFFGEGYETSSQVMSFMLFELAKNPDAQEKLREEINISYEKNNKQFTYESIQEMHYMDACFHETLRKYPAVYYLGKLCTERYSYSTTNPHYKNISFTVEPDTPIIFPIGGLHMDPKYFETPDKFIPERFLDKENVKRYTYMPFGDGPRSCLGIRFAHMQIKTGMVYLLKNFEIKLNNKTQLPLTFDPWYFMLSPKGGLWLNFYKL